VANAVGPGSALGLDLDVLCDRGLTAVPLWATHFLLDWGRLGRSPGFRCIPRTPACPRQGFFWGPTGFGVFPPRGVTPKLSAFPEASLCVEAMS
jgi:hypothetical protein